MDLDLDPAPVHAPIDQPEDVHHDQEIDNADDITTATTSKKKGPKKPLQSKAEGGSKVKDSERAPGTTALPVSRVKKVLSADADLQNTSREALFLISVATEQFLKRMTDASYLKARLDGRKTVTIRDISGVVKENPEMDFLSDIVPETVPLSVALASRKKLAQESKFTAALADNQPLSALVPQVPIMPSRNPEYPDALIRLFKNPSKAKTSKKNAAGTAAVTEGGDADMTADGGGEAVEEDTPQSTTTVPKKASKAKAKARKSAIAIEVDMEGATDSTRSEPGTNKSTNTVPRPKPTQKIAIRQADPPTPTVGTSAGDGDGDAMDES